MSRIGVLGGMGPSATADFMNKVIRLTPAARDQDHLPMIIANLPQIPDRSSSILGIGPDPLPALLMGIDILNSVGVGVIAIPCNSSHHWYAQMSARSVAPIIHIAHTCVSAVIPTSGDKVAIFATRGAVASGFYQQALAAKGIRFMIPDPTSCQTHIDDCIHAVKAGKLSEGSDQLNCALKMIATDGVTAVIMGCTEIPIAAQRIIDNKLQLIDSTLELARATVAYAVDNGWNRFS